MDRHYDAEDGAVLISSKPGCAHLRFDRQRSEERLAWLERLGQREEAQELRAAMQLAFGES